MDTSMFDGWGDTLRGITEFAARSYIDAEYNAPTRLAERKLALRAEDGSLFGAGDVQGAANAIGGSKLMPWLLIGGVLLAVVLIVKE